MIDCVKNNLEKNLYVISIYCRQLTGTVVLFIIARYLSVYDFGLFSSYKNIAMFCLMFANMEFANYILVSSKAKVKEVNLKIAFFILNAIAQVLIISTFSFFFKLEQHILFILVLTRTFLDGTFFALILPYFQATRKFNTIAQINIFYSFAILFVAILSFFLKLSITKFLLLNITLGLLNFVQCSYYAKIKYLLVVKHIKAIFSKIDRAIWGYAGSTFTDYLYAQTSSLYVALFFNKEEAALYFAAYTISTITGLISAAQTQKMLPELINTTNIIRKRILHKNLKAILIILSLALLFIILFGKLLLKLLYGQDYYSNAHIILILYFIANIFIANGAIHGINITAMGEQSKKVQLKLESALVTICSLTLLHKFGIYGAVCSLLIASIYVSFRFTFFSYYLLKNKTT